MKLIEILEILNEGAFKYEDLDKHSGKYVRAFIAQVNSGKPTLLADGRKVKFDTNHKNYKALVTKSSATDEKISQFLKGVKLVTTDNEELAWTKIEKTPFSMGEAKFNRGEVAEGIMGAALAAKFMQPDEEVQLDAIHGVLNRMNVTEKSATASLPHRSDESGKDVIQLSIFLKQNSMKALFDKENWPDLGSEFTSAIKYANSKYVTEHAKLLNSNGTNDKVEISSMGSKDEKGTKADLQVMIGLNGKKPTKANLSLSIKTGQTKNLEQTGVSYERISDAFAVFGIDIAEMNASFVKQESWYSEAFKLAVNKFNTGLDASDGERKFISRLGKGVKYFATKDEDIVKVHLTDGDFKVANYSDLEDKIKDYELEAQYGGDEKRPQITIRDKTSKNVLVTFRIEVRNETEVYKMHIEGGKLLDLLTHEEK